MRSEGSFSPERRDRTGEVIDQELAQIDEELLVEKYKPAFLGYGGEHIVFSLPEHPNVVAKVEKGILLAGIARNLSEGEPIGTFPEDEASQRAKDAFIEAERRRARELKKFFGDAALSERAYAMRVPVTRTLIESAHAFDLAKQVPEGAHDVMALVRIQERAPEAAFSPEAKSLNFRYLESDERLDAESYQRINAALLDGGVSNVSAHDIGSAMEEFVDTLASDDALKERAVDFVERAMRYSEATGELLDLAGPNNVAFFQDGDRWDYVLVDAKYPGTNTFDTAKEQLNQFLEGSQMDPGQANEILNMLNYVRTINFLATQLGIEHRLRVADQPLASRSEQLLNLLRENVPGAVQESE